MEHSPKRILGTFLALTLLLSPLTPAKGDAAPSLTSALNDTAQFLCQTVAIPQFGAIGGEWTVLGLARSGYHVPADYYQTYYAGVAEYARTCGGILHEKKYTEFSRLILALTAIGRNPANVAGYNMLTPLGDYDKTVRQGVNGAVWALLALDCGGYAMPQNPTAKTQATRQMYVAFILSRQGADGGFSLTGGSSDADLSGMALQALAPYRDQPAVADAIDHTLSRLSQMQGSDGGYSGWGTAGAESVAQVLVGLCQLGLSPNDPRFVKGSNTLLKNLFTHYRQGAGFLHAAEEGSSLMASEQALCALVAVRRQAEAASGLYTMDDVPPISGETGNAQPGGGLPGKHAAVNVLPITLPGKTFPDVAAHPDRTAMDALAARGILSGKDGGSFDPEAPMTRSEFSAAVVRALGLSSVAGTAFSDVTADAWYAPMVGTATAYGIVTGRGDGTFGPSAHITRQETAVMVTNAAKLCGLTAATDAAHLRDTLAPFPDYTTSAVWARPALAFCYGTNLLDQSDASIRPMEQIKRCEIARLLFRLLTEANL